MIFTPGFVADRFRHFNSIIFRGELPEVPMKITSARSYAGKLCARRSRFGLRATCELLFSDAIDCPERMLEDIMIHEMIHLAIHIRGIRDSTPHGKVFRSLMNDINSRFGRAISISVRINRMSHTGTTQPACDGTAVRFAGRPHLTGWLDDGYPNAYRPTEKRMRDVALVRFVDGRYGICVPASTAYDTVRQGMRRWDKIDACVWIRSREPMFSLFPRFRSAKVSLITHAMMSEICQRTGTHEI